MIEIKNGHLKIEGSNADVMYEFAELYDMMVRLHPEMAHSTILVWGDDLLKHIYKVDPLIINLTHKLTENMKQLIEKENEKQ